MTATSKGLDDNHAGNNNYMNDAYAGNDADSSHDDDHSNNYDTFFEALESNANHDTEKIEMNINILILLILKE